MKPKGGQPHAALVAPHGELRIARQLQAAGQPLREAQAAAQGRPREAPKSDLELLEIARS